ncbi:MAG: hypothetical protein ACRDND_30595 [Streptosporangiaceae bacterium]
MNIRKTVGYLKNLSLARDPACGLQALIAASGVQRSAQQLRAGRA